MVLHFSHPHLHSASLLHDNRRRIYGNAIEVLHSAGYTILAHFHSWQWSIIDFLCHATRSGRGAPSTISLKAKFFKLKAHRCSNIANAFRRHKNDYLFIIYLGRYLYIFFYTHHLVLKLPFYFPILFLSHHDHAIKILQS